MGDKDAASASPIPSVDFYTLHGTYFNEFVHLYFYFLGCGDCFSSPTNAAIFVFNYFFVSCLCSAFLGL